MYKGVKNGKKKYFEMFLVFFISFWNVFSIFYKFFFVIFIYEYIVAKVFIIWYLRKYFWIVHAAVMFLVVLEGPRLGDPLGRPGDFLIGKVFRPGLFFFDGGPHFLGGAVTDTTNFVSFFLFLEPRGGPRFFLGCEDMPDKMSWIAP